MSANPTTIRRLYVWQIPVRLYHWINALCILVLIVTGFVIGRPITVQTSGEASFNYWFGTVRFIHFSTAFVFFFNFLFRIYWGFTGNHFASWRHFIPHRRQQFREVVQVLNSDVLLRETKPVEWPGHNALAGFTYFLLFLVFLFQCATGFALYAPMSDWWLPGLFAWITPVMGGDAVVRQWHHVMMWFFILFTVVHVYVVFYHDYVDGRGDVSSIVGGWKFPEEPASEQPHKSPQELS